MREMSVSTMSSSSPSSSLLAFSIFVGTASLIVVAIKNIKQKRRCTNDNNKSSLSKEEVLKIREKHFSKSVSVSYANSGPLMIVEGTKSRLVDETGQSYLDTRNNVAHCGHGHPRVVRAVCDQLRTLNTNTRYLHPNATLLAERLARSMPTSLDVVFFVNSGSEANDLALRLARAYTKSKNTVVVRGAYHGHTLAVLEISPYKYKHGTEFDLAKQQSSASTTFKTPGKHIWEVPCPDIYRGQHRGPDAGKKYAEYVREACEFYRRECRENVGAFIMEGGMSIGGALLPPPDYLATCVGAVREAGGVYIADEVQTGFGRFGSCYWAFRHRDNDNVVPDIVTVGKPFGNGMPLGAVVTTPDIARAFQATGVEYFNTFGGNPVCAAAGLAVMDIIESENLQANAVEVGKYLKSRFLELKDRLDIIGDVRGEGLFMGIELVRNRDTLEPATAETSFICTKLKEKYKILTTIDGIHDNVFIVKPPMVFDKDDVDTFVDSFEKVVRDDLSTIGDIEKVAKTPT